MSLPTEISFSSNDFYCEHLFDNPMNEFLIQSFTVKNKSGEGLANFLKKHAAHSEEANENKTYLVKDKTTNEVAGYFALRNGLFTLHHPVYKDKMFTVPAIELSNFAVNESYRQNHPNTLEIGRKILYDFIIPIFKYIQSLTAVQALYIYALPEDRLLGHYGALGFSRLEKDEEKFVHQNVKPAYDRRCIFMYQIL